MSKTAKKFYKNNSSLKVADPFVYRWLGKYYMFVTGNYCPVYRSENLVDWELIGTAIEPDPENIDILGCYAPEVTYFGGLFYLVYSPKGNEHRIYCSNELTKGYTPCKDIRFEGIDGSFFVEKDGVTLFRSADTKGKHERGIYFSTVSSPEKFTYEGFKLISEAYLNSWTEGPMLFERNGYRFLTLTGNHFLSKGYRVDYLSGQGQNYDEYKYRDNILLNTEGNYYGLGHSSTTFAPNLDGLIIAYHNMKTKFIKGMPKTPVSRYYGFTSLQTDGAYLYANGLGNYPSPTPLKADFECEGRDGLTLSDNKFSVPIVSNIFTAELSFLSNSPAKIYIGGYTLTIKKKIAELSCEDTCLKENITPIRDNAVWVVRIENKDKCRIFINGALVFETVLTFGFVAYSNEIIPLFTAYSKSAGGSSDKQLIKNIPSKFPISSCKEDLLPQEENGVNYYKSTSGASFTLNISKSGLYAIILSVNCEKKNACTIEVDGKEYKAIVGGGKLKIHAFTIPLKKGLAEFKISTNTKISDIEFVKLSKTAKKITAVNTKEFVSAYGEFNFEIDKQENYCVALSKKHFNEGEVSFTTDNPSEYAGGVMLRANDYAHYPDHPLESYYGYLVAVFGGKVHLYKTHYGKTKIASFALHDSAIINLKVVLKDTLISIYQDGKIIGNHADEQAIFFGKVGILNVNNLAITQLKAK